MKYLLILLAGIVTFGAGLTSLVLFEFVDSKNHVGFLNEAFILVPVGYLLMGIGLILGLVYRTHVKKRSL